MWAVLNSGRGLVVTWNCAGVLRVLIVARPRTHFQGKIVVLIS